ncbi:hypothetical protein L873DRAFT_1812004 [Choiromyces venosus 120613-1]|uniref:Uncharacterized protein n=1 Tax=Choiromyces venosus 120613-1 TaxID=1336337 RepID=A0A3N4JHS2_9PEZI|nr:hypothetical protein L873DRAFT_1812004 [Choiromyces venosus 120613-1]
MCKRGKGNVRDHFRRLQQGQMTENQDNKMGLMGHKILHVQKQIMIATMTMMEQISRSTSTCTTEAGVGCSRSAKGTRRVLLLAKSSTSIAKSWRRNQQVEKLVEIEFRSVMHVIIIAIHRHHHHHHNRRKKHPPFTWKKNLKTTRSNHVTVESILQDNTSRKFPDRSEKSKNKNKRNQHRRKKEGSKYS